MFGIKMYMGEDLGWLFLNDQWGNILRFDTEDKADNYAMKLEFSYNKFIYEIEEIPEYETE